MEMRSSRLAASIVLALSVGGAGYGSAASASPASTQWANLMAPRTHLVQAPTTWPNATNTGYQAAPGYPGHLTTYSPIPNGTACSGPIDSNKTYSYCYFPSGVEVGTAGIPGTPVNVTFIGCLFESDFNGFGNGSQALVKYSNGNNLVISYSTFKPSGISAPPVSYEQGVAYGVNQVEDAPNYNAGSFSVDHSNFWGLADAAEIGLSSQQQPVTISDSYIHDPRADGGGVDHTDGILSNDGDTVAYLTINHNTLIAVANNEAIALQYSTAYYDHVTVTNNYVSGWHNTVDFGGDGAGNTNDTFTGNVYGTDLMPTNSALYSVYDGDNRWETAFGNTWRNNTLYVVPGSSYAPVSDSGKFWVPQWTDLGWPLLWTTDWAQ